MCQRERAPERHARTPQTDRESELVAATGIVIPWSVKAASATCSGRVDPGLLSLRA